MGSGQWAVGKRQVCNKPGSCQKGRKAERQAPPAPRSPGPSGYRTHARQTDYDTGLVVRLPLCGLERGHREGGGGEKAWEGADSDEYSDITGDDTPGTVLT